MQNVQVVNHGQISLPPEIMQKMNIYPNDVLNIAVVDNSIMLTHTQPKKISAKLNSFMAFKGVGESIADKDNPNSTIQAVREDREL